MGAEEAAEARDLTGDLRPPRVAVVANELKHRKWRLFELLKLGFAMAMKT